MPLQIRRGPTADRLANTPLAGEIVYDTTTGSVYVGNGTTAGGLPVTNFSVGDARFITATMFLGDSLSDNTVHSGVTFAYIGDRLQATVQQNLSNYIGQIGADQGFAGNLWADDSGLIVDSATSTVYGNFVPQGNIIPDTNIAYDLGSAAYRFRDLYLSGSSIYLGNAIITSTGTAIDFPVGSTIGGQPVGINEGDAYNIVLTGNVIGTDSTVLVNTTNGTFHGDLTGSVFADDSTMLVDGRDGVLRGTLIGALTGNVTGNLTGNASTASAASTVSLTASNSSTDTHYITFSLNTTGNEAVRTDTGITYQPSANRLTVTALSSTDINGSSITGNIFTTLIDSADSGAITVTPAMIFNSDVTIENELFVGGDVFPSISEYYNLGSYTKKFNKLYIAEGANALWIGNAAISGSGSIIDLPTGTTVGGSPITTAAGSNASTITVGTNGTNVDMFVSFFDGQSGPQTILTDSTFKYNPNTNRLTIENATITTVTGNLIGNVTGAVTGAVTGNIFTSLIDSADSSAITVTPAVVLSSDVTVENNLIVNNIILNGTEHNNIGRELFPTPQNNETADHYLTFLDSFNGRSIVKTDGNFRYNPTTKYVDTPGVLTQNVNSTGILYLTSTYSASVSVPDQSLVSVGSNSTNRRLRIVSNASFNTAAIVEIGQHHEVADVNNFQFLRSRGTSAARTAVTSGDDIADITFGGFDGTTIQVRASISATVTGAVSAGTVPTNITFNTSPSGTGTPVAAVTIDSNQRTTFGGAIKLVVYANAAARDDAITSPTAGMMVFNTTSTKFQGYTGAAWVDLN